MLFLLIGAMLAVLAALQARPAEASPYGPGSIYYDYGQAQRILNNPNITLWPGVRHDIVSGIADPAVLDVIEFSARRYPIAVSSIKTKHPYANSPTLGMPGSPGYPNSHYYGWAVDIADVNGAPVSPYNSSARDLARQLHYDKAFAVQELGSPWDFGPYSFTNADHRNHIHVGWTYAH